MEIMENAPDIIVYNHQISERTISLLQVEMERFISIFNTHFKSNVKYLNRLNDSKNFRKHFGANWHPMGTTPMGLDRLTAICDPDLQVIGVKNLFVLSASVFPSGSNSNPTFTVLALACRLANSKHFKDNYRL
jgi:choline dehydrogenase-like flavoprotein